MWLSCERLGGPAVEALELEFRAGFWEWRREVQVKLKENTVNHKRNNTEKLSHHYTTTRGEKTI